MTKTLLKLSLFLLLSYSVFTFLGNDKYQTHVENWVKCSCSLEDYLKQINQYDNWKKSNLSTRDFLIDISK